MVRDFILNKYSIPVGSGPEKFYNQLAYLNSVKVYDKEDIAQHQISILRGYIGNKRNLIKLGIEKDFNARAINLGNNDLDAAIAFIEQTLNDFKEDINSNTAVSKENLESKYYIWLNSLTALSKKILNIYEILQSEGKITENDIVIINESLARIEQFINDIDISLSESKVWKKRNYKGKIINMVSTQGFINTISGLINSLKGGTGELIGKNWINSRLQVKDIRAVQLGNIMGPIYNVGGSQVTGNRQLTTDIGIFDLNLAKHLEIRISVDGKEKRISLLDFLNGVEKGEYNHKKTILLDETYLEAMVSGIQAKMGKNQKIFNPSLRTKISLNEINIYSSKALKALEEAKKIKYIDEHDDYDALFNYSLAPKLHYLLGKDNNYILTRTGLQSIPEFIKNNNYYFHITKKYRLGTSNTKYQISYSKLDK